MFAPRWKCFRNCWREWRSQWSRGDAKANPSDTVMLQSVGSRNDSSLPIRQSPRSYKGTLTRRWLSASCLHCCYSQGTRVCTPAPTVPQGGGAGEDRDLGIWVSSMGYSGGIKALFPTFHINRQQRFFKGLVYFLLLRVRRCCCYF